MKKLIKNGKIVTSEKIIDGDILIEDGKIKEIIDHSKVKGSTTKFFDGKQQTLFAGGRAKIIDAQGKYILPGLVEIHGHLREPGFEQKKIFLMGHERE